MLDGVETGAHHRAAPLAIDRDETQDRGPVQDHGPVVDLAVPRICGSVVGPVDGRVGLGTDQADRETAAEAIARRLGPGSGQDGRGQGFASRPHLERAVPAAIFPQLEHQLTAGDDLVMPQIASIESFAVPGHPFDPTRALPAGPEGAAVLEAHGHGLVKGRNHEPLPRAGSYVVETQSGEDVPARHLSTVLVADEAVGLVVVEIGENASHAVGTALGVVGEVVEPGHVVAGLVAVGVLAPTTGDVGLLPAGGGAVDLEERVKGCFETLVSTQGVHVDGGVVGSREAILPAVGLGVMKIHLSRIVGSQPSPVATGTEEAGRGVEEMAPGLGPPPEFRRDVGTPQRSGHPRDAGVVVGVFESLAHRLALVVGADEPLAPVGLEPEVIAARAVEHGVQREIGIEPSDALEMGVGDHGHRVVADHAVGLVGGQLPDR